MNLMDLFGSPIQAPRQRHSRTSTAAADSIQHELPRLQAQVYSAIKEAGSRGLTDEEGIDVTGLSPSTYRPRRIELQTKRGIVKDSGRTRLTRSKRSAVVYVAS